MKILNIKGIIILITVLAVVQFVVGMLISPLLGPIVIKAINESSGAKISAAKTSIWPLTLSCSLKDLKVFDPKGDNERIALVRDASLRISLLALLSKRLVISRLTVSGAEISIKGEPDGSFNLQKIAKPKDAAEKPSIKTRLLDRFRQKKDWFGRIYEIIKSVSSKEAAEKKAVERAGAKKNFPRNRRASSGEKSAIRKGQR